MPNASFKGKVDAQCPFFRFDEVKKKRIVCEGFVDGSNVALIYCRTLDYETQLSVFCCEHYKKCEVYLALMKYKYEDD